MRLISNRGATDPRTNLALEDYCLRRLDMGHTYVLLYVNEPSVIIGRNQNPILEVNRASLRKKNLPVVRRVSGGGAVYHDPGNLNFSFLTRYDRNYFHNFRHFTQPIIDALHHLGVPAEMNDKNDIVVGGRKVSGNAQYSTGKAMLSHGTLLFDSDLTALEQALDAMDATGIDIRSKALASIRSRVANISDYLPVSPVSIDMAAFRSLLLESLFTPFGRIKEHPLSEDDWMRVQNLAEEKYGSWEWTYGRSPQFEIECTGRFKCGTLQARITVEKGVIRGCDLSIDSLKKADIRSLETRLIGARFGAEAIRNLLKEPDLKTAVGPVNPKAFADFLSPFP
jgi:lipoate---protein ligase